MMETEVGIEDKQKMGIKKAIFYSEREFILLGAM